MRALVDMPLMFYMYIWKLNQNNFAALSKIAFTSLIVIIKFSDLTRIGFRMYHICLNVVDPFCLMFSMRKC